MTGSVQLEQADWLCRRLVGRHYENFTVSTPLLPKDKRQHFARLYAFCRVTDDLGDETGPEAQGLIELWRADLLRCFEAESTPLHPVLLALRETIWEFTLPEQPFLDLIAANLQDQWVHRYQDWDQLLRYCQLSAAPVGRLVLRLFGLDSRELDRFSDDVCIGLQLANFAQDVKVDATKGRCYLPQVELEAGSTQAAVRATCARAVQLLRAGRRLEPAVPIRLRLQLALYRLGGEAIVAAIEGIGYRTDLKRPRVSALKKLTLLPQAWRETMFNHGYLQGNPAV